MSRPLIDMALRRVREGAGTYTSGPSNQWVQKIPDLRRWFADVPFLVVGGLATRLYMPERMTGDVDVLVAADNLQRVEQELEKYRARRIGPLSIGGSAWRLSDGRELDLIATAAPWCTQAFREAREGPDGQPYIDLPWLTLLKLESSRPQDLADLSRMLGNAGPALRDRIREVVARYRPGDSEDIESLIKLGDLEKK